MHVIWGRYPLMASEVVEQLTAKDPLASEDGAHAVGAPGAQKGARLQGEWTQLRLFTAGQRGGMRGHRERVVFGARFWGITHADAGWLC